MSRCCGDFGGATWSEEVAGYEIEYFYGNRIRVWNNGDFYTLPVAYEQELLTEQNMGEIHERWVSR
jgi:hypothetical protein